MNTPDGEVGKWTERPNAFLAWLGDTSGMFQLLFERSADAIVLFDPLLNSVVDCNDAAVALMRAGTKENLLQVTTAALAPPLQPDGRSSIEKAAELAARVRQQGSHRFEWVARRLDGTEVPP